MKNKDFFQTISTFSHTFAIYLTFTLDKVVIDKIAENSYGNIIILHDYRQGVTLKNNWGNRVVCIPVNTNKQHNQNYFHSKLALLKGDESAKLLLGSANLSKNSFSKEKEICFEIEIDFYSEFYNNILDYINSLIPQTHTSPSVLANGIKRLRFSNDEVKKQSELNFVNASLNTSIANGICKNLNNDEEPILKIASPFLSRDFKIELSDFIKQVNPKEVQLYLRKNYPLPDEFKALSHRLKLFQPKPKSKRDGFHAKLISIEYKKDTIAYIGSANFSRQGFFLNLEQGANQECGVIITSKEKPLDDWFKTGWEERAPEKEGDLSLFEQDEEIFQVDPYVMAERISQSEVLLSFYNLNEDKINEVFADKKKINLKPNNKFKNLNIYYCNYILKKETVFIEIGKSFSEEIIIFNADSFEERAKANGESLFFESNNMDTVNPKKLQGAIEKDGIRILAKGTVIIEPPYLEQYFYNVKNKISVLTRRKYFSDSHTEELQTELENYSGGEGIYFIIQLLKCFENKKQTKLYEICDNRLQKLLTETENLNISLQSLKAFLKKWKKQ